MADLQLAIKAVDQASAELRKVKASLEGVGAGADTADKKVKQSSESMSAAMKRVAVEIAAIRGAWGFLQDSLKEAVEAEQATARLGSALRQMGYDAGAVAPALERQAEALHQSTLYTKEQVQDLQQLAIRYGVAPEAIDRTTRAVLDYASATGKDATGALTALIKGVDNGGEGLSRLGISIESTGSKTKDLDAAVAALSKKMGGSAVATASGLAGQLDQLRKAADDTKETFGKLIHETGILAKVIGWVKTANDEWGDLFDEKETQRLARMRHMSMAQDVLIEKIRELKSLEEQAKSGIASPEQVVRAEKLRIEISRIRAQLQGISDDRAKASRDALGSGEALPGSSGLNVDIDEEPKSKASRAKKDIDQAEKDLEKLQKEQDKAVEDYFRQQKKKDRENERSLDEIAKDTKKAADERVRMEKEEAKKREAALLESAEALRQQREVWADAANDIAYTFASTLTSEIKNLLMGGKFDFRSLMGRIAEAGLNYAINVATGGIGGGIASALLSHTGGPVGDSYHTGGMVRARHYHSGGLAADEVPAILQTGEYVVSRDDVRRNGGSRGLEKSLKGGGGTNVYVATLDSLSFQSYLGGRGGSGMVRTVRSGRGELTQMMRRLGRR